MADFDDFESPQSLVIPKKESPTPLASPQKPPPLQITMESLPNEDKASRNGTQCDEGEASAQRNWPVDRIREDSMQVQLESNLGKHACEQPQHMHAKSDRVPAKRPHYDSLSQIKEIVNDTKIGFKAGREEGPATRRKYEKVLKTPAMQQAARNQMETSRDYRVEMSQHRLRQIQAENERVVGMANVEEDRAMKMAEKKEIQEANQAKAICAEAIKMAAIRRSMEVAKAETARKNAVAEANMAYQIKRAGQLMEQTTANMQCDMFLQSLEKVKEKSWLRSELDKLSNGRLEATVEDSEQAGGD
ncbi:hypothetical protein BU16DRAFT_592462 [Lophium mytilinum]|uniref:Uncharacterized protein n=1 Tax=Lophium mytilinum TaxID=390894 RepID=A0A6A6QKV4_9PEZI|nr:hypothetical protein BU16DRAFT_592462 [Lophium mytilinum]